MLLGEGLEGLNSHATSSLPLLPVCLGRHDHSASHSGQDACQWLPRFPATVDSNLSGVTSPNKPSTRCLGHGLLSQKQKSN